MLVVFILKGRPSNQLIQNMSLQATLRIGWQAPGGIVGHGSHKSVIMIYLIMVDIAVVRGALGGGYRMVTGWLRNGYGVGTGRLWGRCAFGDVSFGCVPKQIEL